jgi:4-azaleucine resistance transporter AzlC
MIEGKGQAPFTLAGIRHGFIRAQGLAPGVMLYGVVFGILATEARLSALEAVLTSAVVYSGSAQVAALQIWREGAELLPLLSAILMMNARYLLYGAALRPWLGNAPPVASYSTLFFLGDGNWALAMAERARGQDDAGFILGSGVAMFIPWVGGTLAGRLVGDLIGQPDAYGLDFMLVAFSAALLMNSYTSKVDGWPIGAAALVTLLLTPVLSGGWIIIAGALVAALTGALMFKQSQ